MADSKLQLTSLDFDSIKQNLKTFLKSQSEFQDFDFEGSAINVLLDLLAYNTFYNGFYLNMIGNEMFLDTAVLRKSVVSHAKLLGYVPRSATASIAYLDVTVNKNPADQTTLLNIPRFTPFASQALNGISYTFYTTDDTAFVANSNTQFAFTMVPVKEGSPVTKSFLVDNATNPEQYFDLVDSGIDTSTLMVNVQISQSNPSFDVYLTTKDVSDVGANSHVYFLEEGTSGNYRIYFGDGIFGKKLDDQNVVNVSYLKTNADAANGSRKFSMQSQLLAGSLTTATMNSAYTASAGGTPQETIQSIKFTAPKSFVAQDRAVTKNDYIAMINKDYPYFDAVTVWGGEEEVPPVYGKVFISAKPKNGFEVTASEQQVLLQQVLKPISVLTVTPEYVQADYNYLNFYLTVEYDPKLTHATTQQLQSSIRSAVNDFATSTLNSFNGTFKYSKFLKSIDGVDPSIQSTSAVMFIEKRIRPDLISPQSYIVKFGTELHRGVTNDRVYSSPYFVQADSDGVNQQCYLEETPFSFGGIDQINIDAAGTGYTTNPTLTIVGDGSGANAYAQIVNGKIAKVTIDKRGDQYTTAIISISGGGGTGATLTPVLAGRIGALRTFYYDSNNIKRILNHDAGTIDYVNGILYINNFGPTDVSESFKTLSIHAQPMNYNFASAKNIVITYDSVGTDSININLVPVSA